MEFEFTVRCSVERQQGKFASKDEIREYISNALTDADPQSIDGVGADGSSEYEVTDWEVS